MAAAVTGGRGVLDLELLNELKQQHPGLRSINLAHNALHSLQGIGTLSTLETLRVGHNQLTDLYGVHELNNLRELAAPNNLM